MSALGLRNSTEPACVKAATGFARLCSDLAGAASSGLGSAERATPKPAARALFKFRPHCRTSW